MRQNSEAFQFKAEQFFQFNYELEEENFLSYLYNIKKDAEDNLSNMKEVFNYYKPMSKESSYHPINNDLFISKNEFDIPSPLCINNDETDIKTEEFLILKENLMLIIIFDNHNLPKSLSNIKKYKKREEF